MSNEPLVKVVEDPGSANDQNFVATTRPQCYKLDHETTTHFTRSAGSFVGK
jgi:hypothetical protein